MTILTPAQVQEIENEWIGMAIIRTHHTECWHYHPECAIALLAASQRAVVEELEKRDKLDVLPSPDRKVADLMRRNRILRDEKKLLEAEATRLLAALETVGKQLNCSDDVPWCQDRTVSNTAHFDCHIHEAILTVQQALTGPSDTNKRVPHEAERR